MGEELKEYEAKLALADRAAQGEQVRLSLALSLSHTLSL